MVDLNFNVDEFNKYFDHQKMISKMGSASQAGDMKDVLQLVVDSGMKKLLSNTYM